MSSPIEQAIRQIVEEKGLQYEAVVDAIESALAAAYRKDFGDKNQNTEVKFNTEDGSMQVWDIKTVVEDVDLEELERLDLERQTRAEELAEQIEKARKTGEPMPTISIDEELAPRFNPKTDIMISEARVLKHNVQIGDVIRNELPQPEEFGRMAAMTAKQVITQKLREAEREVVYNEFKEHEGELMNGTVQRREGRVVLVDLGRTTAIMRPEDQIPFERYNTGERLKVFVRQVGLTTKGPEILVSRTSEELVRKLFEIEIPEIADKTVVIKSLAREAGSRTKVAVTTADDSIDPIGACIGQRGSRIQTIISELGGEKVDIIEWEEDPKLFITHALSPAKVTEVEINENDHSASVKVEVDQLSLAIGKGGQNVRLAAHLTGWKINIGEAEAVVEESDEEKSEEVATEVLEMTAETEKENGVPEKIETSKEVTETVEIEPSEVDETVDDGEEEK